MFWEIKEEMKDDEEKEDANKERKEKGFEKVWSLKISSWFSVKDVSKSCLLENFWILFQ